MDGLMTVTAGRTLAGTLMKIQKGPNRGIKPMGTKDILRAVAHTLCTVFLTSEPKLMETAE